MTMWLMALALLSQCDAPTYRAFGMEVYLEDTDKPTKAEFVKVTREYFRAFNRLTGIKRRHTKHIVVEFHGGKVYCPGHGLVYGCYVPGSIKVHYEGTLRGSAWAHELGHHYHRFVYGHSGGSHLNKKWWGDVELIRKGKYK